MHALPLGDAVRRPEADQLSGIQTVMPFGPRLFHT
jgi:hypothetical protein